jgi:hypothetical protein
VWAPDATSFVRDSLTRALITDVDSSQSFSGYSVHVQTLRAGDGTLLVGSVDRL